MKSKITALKNHFDRNRFKYGVATGVVATVGAAHVIASRTEEIKEFAEEYVAPHMPTAE